MTRITEKQRTAIITLFASGTTIDTLARSFSVTGERIEQIIREALLKQPKPEDF